MIEAIATITALLSLMVLIGLFCKLFIKGYIGDEDDQDTRH